MPERVPFYVCQRFKGKRQLEKARVLFHIESLQSSPGRRRGKNCRLARASPTKLQNIKTPAEVHDKKLLIPSRLFVCSVNSCMYACMFERLLTSSCSHFQPPTRTEMGSPYLVDICADLPWGPSLGNQYALSFKRGFRVS